MIGPVTPLNFARLATPASPVQPTETGPVDQAQILGPNASVPTGAAPNASSIQAALAAVPLLGRLAALADVQLLVRKKFRLPLQAKNDPVRPEEAARLLEERSTRVRVQTSPDTEPMPLNNPQSLVVLEALHGPGDLASLEQSELGKHIKQLKADGLNLTVGGMQVDAYGAYHYLTSGWPEQNESPQPVEVRLGQLVVGKLKPNEFDPEALQQNVQRARDAVHSPAAALGYLCEQHHNDVKKVAQEMARLENGPQAEHFRGLRERFEKLRGHAGERLKYLNAGLEPLTRGTVSERLDLLDGVDFLRYHQYPHRLQQLGKGYDALREAGVPHAQARQECVDLYQRSNRGYGSSDMTTEAFTELSKLAGESPAIRQFFRTSLEGYGAPGASADRARLISQPAGQTTEDERVALAGKLERLYAAWEPVYRFYQGECQAGRPDAEERTLTLADACRNMGYYGSRSSVEPATEYASQHPDRLGEVCVLIKKGTNPSLLPQILDLLPADGREERLETLQAFQGYSSPELTREALQAYDRQVQRGRDPRTELPNLLARCHSGRRFEPEGGIDAILQTYAREVHDEDSAGALALLAGTRCPGAQVPALFAHVASWSGPSTRSERMAALNSLAFSQRYRPEGKILADAVKTLLANGMPLDQATERLEKACNSLYSYSHEAKNLLPGLGYICEKLADDAPSIDLFTRLMGHRHELETARLITDSMRQSPQDAETIGILNRNGAMRDDGVVRAALHAYNTVRKPEWLAPLAGATQNLAPEQARKAYEFAATLDREPALATLAQLIGNKMPAEVACDAVASLEHAASLKGLGYPTLESPVVHALAEGLPQGQASVGRLCQALNERALPTDEAVALVRTWSQKLAHDPEQTELFSRLIEFRQDAPTLQGILGQNVEGTTPRQRLQAFVDADGFQRSELTRAAAELFMAQLVHGAPLEEASQLTKSFSSLYRRGEQVPILAAATEHFADSGPLLRAFMAEAGRDDLESSIALVTELRRESPATTLEERARDFTEMRRFFSQNPGPAFEAYRQLRAAGWEAKAALSGLTGLAQGLYSQQTQAPQAFAYLGAHPEKAAALTALTQQGFRPALAIQVIEQARDLDREVETLGQFRASSKSYQKPDLDEATLQAFQQGLHARLDRGEEAHAELSALGLALKGAPGNLATAYRDRLDSEQCQVLLPYLALGYSGDDALTMLEHILRPAGSTTVAERASLAQLVGCHEQGYDKLASQLDSNAGLYDGAAALVAGGQTCEEAARAMRELSAALPAYPEGRPGGALRYAGQNPEQMELLKHLFQKRIGPERAMRLAQLVAEPAGDSPYAHRVEQLAALKLDVPRVGAEGLWQAFAQARNQGTPVAQALAEIGALRDALGKHGKEAVPGLLQTYSEGLSDRRDLRPFFVQLVATGMPAEVAAQSVRRAVGSLENHVQALTGLGKMGTQLAPEVSEAAQRVLRSLIKGKHPAAECTRMVGELTERLAQIRADKNTCLAALEALEQRYAGKPDEAYVFTQLLDRGGESLEQACSTVEEMSQRPLLRERYDALKALSSWWNRDLVRGYDDLLHGQLQAGVPLERAKQTCQRVKEVRSSPEFEPLLKSLAKRPASLPAWMEIVEAGYKERYRFDWLTPQTIELMGEAPDSLLQLYGRVRQSGASASEAVSILAEVNQPVRRTTVEERSRALVQLCELNEEDQRNWFRRTLGRKDAVASKELLPALVTLYTKLLGFGRKTPEALELIRGIYGVEQSKGRTRSEIQTRLAEIAEVASLDIRPDTGAAVLRDDKDQVVFSGVVLKKRQSS